MSHIADIRVYILVKRIVDYVVLFVVAVVTVSYQHAVIGALAVAVEICV